MASATMASSISWGAILQDGLLAADLLQRQLAAFLVKLLKAVKAVSRITHHLAGLANIAELLGKLQQANLGSNDLLLLGHIGVLLKTPGRGAAQPRPLRARPGLRFAVGPRTPSVRLNFS